MSNPRFNVVLHQPEIPQNTGNILRTGACLGVPVDIIEPCGFVLSDSKLRRAGMDYLEGADVTRHASWEAFHATLRGRLILLTTRGDEPYTQFAFDAGDTLLFGRESAGAPAEVHAAAQARLCIPITSGLRSLNVAAAAAMALGEALRARFDFHAVQVSAVRYMDARAFLVINIIERGDEAYWNLELMEQELFLEADDPDFQTVINRLENKGNDAEMQILKLNEVRNLRIKQGARVKQNLSLGYQNSFVLDSSHLNGANVIKRFVKRRRERRA